MQSRWADPSAVGPLARGPSTRAPPRATRGLARGTYAALPPPKMNSPGARTGSTETVMTDLGG